MMTSCDGDDCSSAVDYCSGESDACSGIICDGSGEGSLLVKGYIRKSSSCLRHDFKIVQPAFFANPDLKIVQPACFVNPDFQDSFSR